MDNRKLLNPLVHLLEIPSVSTQVKHLTDMTRARNYLVDLFTSMGFTSQNLKAKKHDAVFSQLTTDTDKPTVLIYGHYDVQPPEPIEEWTTQPFKPVVKAGKLYARGATDNKGQHMVHVLAIKNLLKKFKGKLPVNVKFIIEGEEEIGSISVEALAKKYAKNLFKCDYLLVSDTEMPAPGQPSIDISLRGLLYAELQLEIGKHDLHSGQFGGVSENPTIVLARIINKLKDKDNKILIPNFYTSVTTPSKQELEDYKKIKASKELIKHEGEIYTTGGGETRYSLNERRWSRPTLDINGIWGGYQDEGSKTIIPAKAGMKLSMRLVPNQKPDEIYADLEKYIKKLVPKDIKYKLTRHADCLPYKAPTDHPVFTLIKQSLKKAFKKDPVFTGVGGSIGFVPVLANKLRVPCILVGFGLPTDRMHSPNENFSLINYYKGIEAMEDFYTKLPNLKSRS